MVDLVVPAIAAALPDWVALPAACWWAVLGAVVGSFLNVLVYRLPRGESIIVPASRCPRCGRAIRWHDNVPVLGWCLLRGRCRDCREPISPRYPAVEAAAVALFLLVGTIEYAAERASGAAPPPTVPATAAGAPGAPSATPARWANAAKEEEPGIRWARVGAIAGFELLLLCALFCAALIAHDGFETPWSLFAPVVLAGLGAPLLAPWLRTGPPVLAGLGNPWAALADGAAGLASGTLLGLLATRATRQSVLVPASAAVGVVFGWMAPLVVVPPGALFGRFARRRGLVVGWWLIGSLAWLVLRAVLARF